MKEMVALAASQIVAAQIRSGAVHPSPPLISAAVDTAEALVAELVKREAARAAAASPPPAAPPTSP